MGEEVDGTVDPESLRLCGPEITSRDSSEFTMTLSLIYCMGFLIFFFFFFLPYHLPLPLSVLPFFSKHQWIAPLPLEEE